MPEMSDTSVCSPSLASLVPIRCGLFIDICRSEFENSPQKLHHNVWCISVENTCNILWQAVTSLFIITFTMFSDIHEDVRSYESSIDSDTNDESTFHGENHFYWPSYTSTNLNNINKSYGHDFAESPENLNFMSTMNLVHPLIAYRIVCGCLHVGLCSYEAEKYII